MDQTVTNEDHHHHHHIGQFTSAFGVGDDAESSSDDDSFKSAYSECSPSLTESMMDVSASPLFRSAHSTLDGGHLGGTSSSSMSASVQSNAIVQVEFSGSDIGVPSPRQRAEDIEKAEEPKGEISDDGAAEQQTKDILAADKGVGDDVAVASPKIASPLPAAPPNIQRVSPTRNKEDGGGSPMQTKQQAAVATSPPRPMHPASNGNSNSSVDDTGPWRLITSRTETSRPNINSVAYNQDVSCVCIGTDRGFRIRTIVPPPQDSSGGGDGGGGTGTNMVHQCNVPSGVSLCHMLYGTSLLAVVRTASPRTLSLANAWTGQSLKELHFVASVKRVEMNRKVLCVLAADGRLHIFNLATLQLIKSIGVVHPSDPARAIEGANASTPGAFFALSNVEDEAYVVCRCRKKLGWVRVYKVTEQSGVRVAPIGSFDAHNHSIARIAIGGRKGSQKLATASEKGTVIRIFSLGAQFSKRDVLLRGSSPCAMHSIAFNADATRVASSSSTGTIHIFKVGGDSQGQGTTSSAANRKSTGSKLKLSRLLPEVVTDQTGGIRSYCKIKIKAERGSGASKPLILAFLASSNATSDNVLSLSRQGSLHRFTVDARGKARQVASEDVLFDEGNVAYNNV